MRLGLPPLGILGIPILITGNKDNPKIKLGRHSEDLEETKDSIN
jgi:AsmA protein